MNQLAIRPQLARQSECFFDPLTLRNQPRKTRAVTGNATTRFNAYNKPLSIHHKLMHHFLECGKARLVGDQLLKFGRTNSGN